jgi:putative transposase
MIIPFEIIVSDFVSFCAALLRSRTALAAENLFLRKHLALFSGTRKEGQADDTCRSFRAIQTRLLFSMAPHLVIVKPATLIGWHRAAFRRFWRWKSRPIGRPPVSVEIRRLIRRMAAENSTWGEERIADELRRARSAVELATITA